MGREGLPMRYGCGLGKSLGVALPCLLAMAVVAGAAQPGQQRPASGASTRQKTGSTQTAQPTGSFTREQLKKIGQIEKLARSVKEKMSFCVQDTRTMLLNPLPPLNR
jgi:hypothetical protein